MTPTPPSYATTHAILSGVFAAEAREVQRASQKYPPSPAKMRREQMMRVSEFQGAAGTDQPAAADHKRRLLRGGPGEQEDEGAASLKHLMKVCDADSIPVLSETPETPGVSINHQVHARFSSPLVDRPQTSSSPPRKVGRGGQSASPRVDSARTARKPDAAAAAPFAAPAPLPAPLAVAASGPSGMVFTSFEPSADVSQSAMNEAMKEALAASSGVATTPRGSAFQVARAARRSSDGEPFAKSAPLMRRGIRNSHEVEARRASLTPSERTRAGGTAPAREGLGGPREGSESVPLRIMRRRPEGAARPQMEELELVPASPRQTELQPVMFLASLQDLGRSNLHELAEGSPSLLLSREMRQASVSDLEPTPWWRAASRGRDSRGQSASPDRQRRSEERGDMLGTPTRQRRFSGAR